MFRVRFQEFEKLFFYFPDLERHDKPKYSKSDMQEALRFLCDLGLQSHHILGTCIAKTEVDVLMSFSEHSLLKLSVINAEELSE